MKRLVAARGIFILDDASSLSTFKMRSICSRTREARSMPAITTDCLDSRRKWQEKLHTTSILCISAACNLSAAIIDCT